MNHGCSCVVSGGQTAAELLEGWRNQQLCPLILATSGHLRQLDVLAAIGRCHDGPAKNLPVRVSLELASNCAARTWWPTARFPRRGGDAQRRAALIRSMR